MMRSPVYAGALSEAAVGGAHALAKLLQWPCDGVLLDRNLPDLDAGEVAEQIRKQYPQIEVEVVDAEAVRTEKGAEADASTTAVAHSNESAESELEATDVAAAVDEELRAIASTSGDENEWCGETSSELREVAEAPEILPLPGMIGSSRAMEQVYRLVQMVANRDTTVLVTGETGTGKELVAGAVQP